MSLLISYQAYKVNDIIILTVSQYELLIIPVLFTQAGGSHLWLAHKLSL